MKAYVDQFCIDQANNDEKLRTIGFMDAIYRQARLVVVLEDIAINEMEEAFLEDLMGKYNHGPAEDLRVHAGSACDASALFMKILSARWFSRTWCSHDILVSGNHIFLIRVKPSRLGSR